MTRVVSVRRSGIIPAPVPRVFESALSLPLPRLYSRRYGPMPPIVGVQDETGPWDTLGCTRVILTADGGAMHEELTSLDRPHHFSNRLTVLRGPFRPVAARLEETWSFASVGAATEATWEWNLYPRPGPAGLVAPLIGRLWQGYARGVLAQLAQELSNHGPN